ncbi:MAG: hypothetical protein EOO05_15660 [Chitinophagaceae bacterium]|nr:MAG: hypothetical protein EOO05_15660 [Chitinophagaceae bacterium]
MKKYQAIIEFTVTEEFQELIAPHRVYINYLINKDLIDQYVVSLELRTAWITINADSQEEAEKLLDKAPLAKFWIWQLTELAVWDGQLYRLPVLQMN